MECSVIDEPIDVLTIFSGKKLIPKMFLWRGRKYKVTKIEGKWNSQCGEDKIFNFSVSSEMGNVYELELHTKDMSWKLAKIYTE